MKKLEKYSNWIIALIFIIIVIAIYKTFDNFYKITEWFGIVIKSLTPFLIGFVIAYILNNPCKKISALCEKCKYGVVKKYKKPISITSVYLIMVLILFVIVRAIVPALYKNALDLYNNIPMYVDQALSAFSRWQAEKGITFFDLNEVDVEKAFNSLLSQIDFNQFSKYAQGVINITSGVIDVFIGFIISVYMLIDKEKIKKSIKRVLKIFLKEEKTNAFVEGVKRVNNIFSKYIFCLLIDAVIMAVLATIVLSLLRVRYALILGGMIGLFNLIPYFGAIFAGVLSVIITLITGGVFKTIWAAVGIILIQQLDGNLISPKIMGNMLNASPLWIILAVTLGGGLFGIGGMIISVPILVTVKMVITDYLREKEAKNSEK